MIRPDGRVVILFRTVSAVLRGEYMNELPYPEERSAAFRVSELAARGLWRVLLLLWLPFMEDRPGDIEENMDPWPMVSHVLTPA